MGEEEIRFLELRARITDAQSRANLPPVRQRELSDDLVANSLKNLPSVSARPNSNPTWSQTELAAHLDGKL
jgi:hypothetical protein